MGLVYALSARYTGALLRLLGQRLSARGPSWSLTLGHLGAGVAGAAGRPPGPGACCGRRRCWGRWPRPPPGRWSRATCRRGRHGAAMRSAIGWFNVVWTPATAVPLLIMPVVARVDLLGTIALSALFNTGAMLALIKLPPRAHPNTPPRPRTPPSGRNTAALLRSASWLLPLSYLISSNLAPILAPPPGRAGQRGARQRGGGQLDGGPLPRPGGDVAAGLLARALGHAAAGGGGAGRRAGAGAAGAGPGRRGGRPGAVRDRHRAHLLRRALLLAGGWPRPGRRRRELRGADRPGLLPGPAAGPGRASCCPGAIPPGRAPPPWSLVWTAAAGIGLAALRPYAAVRRSRRTASR